MGLSNDLYNATIEAISGTKCLYTRLALCMVHIVRLCTELANRHSFMVNINVLHLELG